MKYVIFCDTRFGVITELANGVWKASIHSFIEIVSSGITEDEAVKKLQRKLIAIERICKNENYE